MHHYGHVGRESGGREALPARVEIRSSESRHGATVRALLFGDALRGGYWRVGGFCLCPRSLCARVNMNRMALAVIDQLDLLFRRFTAVFHLDPILGSSIAEGENETRPVLRNH